MYTILTTIFEGAEGSGIRLKEKIGVNITIGGCDCYLFFYTLALETILSKLLYCIVKIQSQKHTMIFLFKGMLSTALVERIHMTSRQPYFGVPKQRNGGHIGVPSHLTGN